MTYTPDALKKRTKQFALRVVRLVQRLDQDSVSQRMGDQLWRAGTSVGANYRAACRARSSAEFRSKLGIVEEEVDESLYWMELLVEAGLVRERLLKELMREGDEILSIIIASINTSARNRSQRQKTTTRSPR